MINDYFYIAAIAALVLVVICLLIAYSKALGEKEGYRARVFELTKGKEGRNLVVVKPDHYPPPPPPKDNITMSAVYRATELRAKTLEEKMESFTTK